MSHPQIQITRNELKSGQLKSLYCKICRKTSWRRYCTSPNHRTNNINQGTLCTASHKHSFTEKITSYSLTIFFLSIALIKLSRIATLLKNKLKVQKVFSNMKKNRKKNKAGSSDFDDFNSAFTVFCWFDNNAIQVILNYVGKKGDSARH